MSNNMSFYENKYENYEYEFIYNYNTYKYIYHNFRINMFFV